MKRYNVWDETESLTGKMVYYSDVEKQDNLFKKLHGWHKKALRHAFNLGLQVEKLEKQNKEMFEMLKITLKHNYIGGWCVVEPDLKKLIEKVEGEQNG